MIFSSIKLCTHSSWVWTEKEYIRENEFLRLLLKDKYAADSNIFTFDSVKNIFDIPASKTQLEASCYSYQIEKITGNSASIVENGEVFIFPSIYSNSNRFSLIQDLEALKKAFSSIAGDNYTSVSMSGKSINFSKSELTKEINMRTAALFPQKIKTIRTSTNI